MSCWEERKGISGEVEEKISGEVSMLVEFFWEEGWKELVERWRKENISGYSSGGCLVGSREKELVERWRENIY